MKKRVLVFLVTSVLCGCVDMPAFEQGLLSGLSPIPIMPATGAPPGNAGRNMPNTPECREYVRFAQISGAPGTLSPLIAKYNACLNSAPNSNIAMKYRCAPGTYYSYVNGVQQCVRR